VTDPGRNNLWTVVRAVLSGHAEEPRHAPDIDLLAAQGERRRKRRRLAVAGAGLAALAADLLQRGALAVNWGLGGSPQPEDRGRVMNVGGDVWAVDAGTRLRW
jgi:hypothetical protein